MIKDGPRKWSPTSIRRQTTPCMLKIAELKPVGEWNATRIIVDYPHVEHWLNGEKVYV